MAIADVEPKKGDGDVTSTGSTTTSKTTKFRSKHNAPIKYSHLKDFSFGVSDVWDDNTICIFLECCYENAEDLKKTAASEENKVWEKIAKSGFERSGNVKCFNVNDCLELANSLKTYISKNERKMMTNDVFKQLHDVVEELFPHFAPVGNLRRRSRSQSEEISKSDKADSTTSSADEPQTISPLRSNSQCKRAVRLIAKVLKKYQIDDFMKAGGRNTVWKEAGALLEQDFGLAVNPRDFLEGYKKSIVFNVGKQSDSSVRAKMFLEQVDDLLPYFDHIPPRAIKKAQFLNLSNDSSQKPISRKRKKNDEDTLETTNEETQPKQTKRILFPDSPKVEVDSTEVTTPSEEVNEDTTSPEMPNLANTAAQPNQAASTSNYDEPIDNQDKKKNNDEPQPEPKPKRRPGRPPKSLVAVQPSRQSARVRKNTNNNANTSTRKPDISDSSPLQRLMMGNKELVPVVKKINLLPTNHGYEYGDSSKQHMMKKPTPPLTSSSPVDYQEDSDTEDVPLIGTKYTRVARPPIAPISKMRTFGGHKYPVVMLDKMNDYDKNFGRVRGAIRGDNYQPQENRKERSIPPGSTSSFVNADTTLPRRRGRPAKNFNVDTKIAPRSACTPVRRPTSSMKVEPDSSQVMRSNGIKNAYRTPNQLQRDLALRRMKLSNGSYDTSSPEVAIPGSNTPAIPNQMLLSHSMTHAPEWFDRFVAETRRHEMWKVHHLMRMHNTLLQSECQKTSVLEKIQVALTEGYGRR